MSVAPRHILFSSHGWEQEVSEIPLLTSHAISQTLPLVVATSSSYHIPPLPQ